MATSVMRESALRSTAPKLRFAVLTETCRLRINVHGASAAQARVIELRPGWLTKDFIYEEYYRKRSIDRSVMQSNTIIQPLNLLAHIRKYPFEHLFAQLEAMIDILLVFRL